MNNWSSKLETPWEKWFSLRGHGDRWRATTGFQSPPSRLIFPAPFCDITDAPAPPRCDARSFCPRTTKEHKVTNSTLQLRAALDKHNRNAEVSLCHLCAFVLLILLTAFEMIRIMLTNLRNVCVSSQCLSRTSVSCNISAAFTRLKLQWCTHIRCIQILKA